MAYFSTSNHFLCDASVNMLCICDLNVVCLYGQGNVTPHVSSQMPPPSLNNSTETNNQLNLPLK